MFTRPDDLPDEMLIDELRKAWGVDVSSLEYKAVGFGSHHWSVRASDGHRWFLTADDLDARQRFPHDSNVAAFERLRAALKTARSVRDGGGYFVAAPALDRDGEVIRHVGHRFALALYAYIDGRSHPWEEYQSAADRLDVLKLIVMLHASPQDAIRDAPVDDFLIPHREGLCRALDDPAEAWEGGPYSEPARALLSKHARGVKDMLVLYDRLALEARAQPERVVLTHGEPHPANLILTNSGWILVDWDTTKIAPPERDLWMLDSGSGEVVAAYQKATGTQVLPAMMDFYRLWWDLAEIAIYIAQFRAPHVDTRDTRESWKNLKFFLNPPHRWPSLS